jgi:hypothetical protein
VLGFTEIDLPIPRGMFSDTAFPDLASPNANLNADSTALVSSS